MNVSEFDYDLPESTIAQEPLGSRDASRLLGLSRTTGEISHRRFRDLPGLLERGDLVVLNDTLVLAARLDGRKPTGGKVEILLLERAGGRDDAPEWTCLARASGRLGPGQRIEIAGGLSATVVDRGPEDPVVTLRFLESEDRVRDAISQVGRMPLPPYVRRLENDPRADFDHERYQTVFARRPGAVAAPTAGLHFTSEVFEALERRGIATAFLTLHTGIATFLPVRTERVEDHRLHGERFELGASVADAVASARERGGRVVAVGTTVVRALEANALEGGRVRPGQGISDLFIYPGFRFRVVDGMITNFHLPRSTLLMLVSAFAGRQTVLSAYAEAIRMGYRFYSYGDAMWIG